MSENKLNISDLLETHRRDRERLHWDGTFRDYFELVTQNPAISKLSHERDKIDLLFLGQLQLQDEVEELHRVFQGEQPAIVEVRRRVLDTAQRKGYRPDCC